MILLVPPINCGPPLRETTRKASLEEIETYISRQHNTVAQYIATRPIMDLCLDMGRSMVSWAQKRWWEQQGLVL